MITNINNYGQIARLRKKYLLRITVILLFIIPAVMGCTIEPVYQASSLTNKDSKVQLLLRKIKIKGEHSRLAQTVKNELIYSLYNSQTRLPKAEYELNLTTTRLTESINIEQIARAPTAKSVTIKINYKLIKLATSKIIASGSVENTATYEWTKQRFSNQQVENSATLGAARQAADLMKRRLILFFRR